MSGGEYERIDQILADSHRKDQEALDLAGNRSRQRLASKRWERRLEAVAAIRRRFDEGILRDPLPDDLIPVVLTRRDIEAILEQHLDRPFGHRARLDLACWDALAEDARLRAGDPEGSQDAQTT